MSSLYSGVGAVILLGVAGYAARAQDIPPGQLLRLDITQQLEASDNPDLDVEEESDIYGRTIFDLGFESVTRVQTFRLNIGVDLEEGRNGQSTIETDSPSAELSYSRAVRNSSIGADFRYRESDVDDDIDDDIFDLDGNVINQREGTRESTVFGLNGEVGREAPIGASWDWRYSEVTYSETNDPDLTDQSNNAVSGRIDFRISPRITTGLTGRYADFDTNGSGVDRETQSVGIASDIQLSRVHSAQLALSYDRITRSGDETGTDEGLSLDAGFTRAMPDGSWGIGFRTDVASNDDGRRSSLSISRNRELPRGALNYSFGLTGADVVGTDPLVSVDYTHLLSTSQVSFGLSQNVVTSDSNDERINTRLNASYAYDVNNLSNLSISLSLFDVNDLSSAGEDRQRIELSLSYRYDLTRDWGLVSGISHTRVTEDNEPDRSRNTLFVGLQRSFSWTP